MKKASKQLASAIIAIGTAMVFYIIMGSVTSVIPNRFFTRMTPVGWLEHASLLITSLLIGAYIGISYYVKATNKDKVCNTSAAAGGVFGFLTFGCSICNKILVFFLGVAGVLTYFDPIRPLLGFFSMGFLGYAIYAKSRVLFAA